MHSMRRYFVDLLMLWTCFAVSGASVVDLRKLDERHNGTSLAVKTEDNAAAINGTNHRKGRCKLNTRKEFFLNIFSPS